MTPERAIETLKELEFTVFATKPRGGQEWRVPGSGLYNTSSQVIFEKKQS